MSIKTIFFDLDGTIYNHQLNCISDNTINTLNKLREKDVNICIATSRPYNGIFNIKNIDKINWDGIVASFGQEVYIKDECIYNVSIPHNDLIKIFEIAKKNDFPLYANGSHEFFNFINDDVLKFKKTFNITTSNIEGYKDQDVKLMTLINSKVIDYNTFFKGIDSIKIINTGGINTDIFLKDTDKVKGIDILLNKLSPNNKSYMSFGDSNSDTLMIKEADIGVATNNATEALKQLADHICDDCDNDGVANYLKEYFRL